MKKYLFFTCAHVFLLRVGVSPRGGALKVCAARRAAEQGSAQGGSEIVKFVSARRAKPRKCTVLRKN